MFILVWIMDLRKIIIKEGFFDALPYVSSLCTKRRFMLLSLETVKHAEKRLVEKMDSIRADKEKELKEKGRISWGIAERNRWNVNVEGFTVDIIDYVSKGVWDFYHYSHICLEMMAQIINIIAFDQKTQLEEEKVNFKDLYKSLPDGYSSIKSFLLRIQQDEHYKYIKAVDNYTKHISTLGVSLKTKNMIAEFDEFVINDFMYCGELYEKRQVSTTLSECGTFVVDTISEFFEVLFNQSTPTEKKDQFTDVKYERLVKGKTTCYLSFFIDMEKTVFKTLYESGDNHVFIRPVTVDSDFRIYEDSEFCFDPVFVRENATGTIIGKAHPVVTSRKGYYHKYRVERSDEDEYMDYIANFQETHTRVSIKNILAFRGVERIVKG